MEYINKVTGNVIEVASALSGKNWEPLDRDMAKKPMTKKDIIDQLKDMGVDFDSAAKKEELEKLLAESMGARDGRVKENE